MNTCRTICFLIGVIYGLCGAQGSIQWQTTRAAPNETWYGGSTGSCRLVSEKIKITLYPFYVDVEEEASISPQGSVWSGDSATLELFGSFTLTPGAALRSMLLWEGNKILKAKLVDHIAADSAYEAIVDRSQPQPVRHDPAQIAFTGNNAYSFRIYPVGLGGSRKIRVLYSVPYTLKSTGPRFFISTAFASGAASYPTQVPVEIYKSQGVPGNYLFSYGNVTKTVQFGATYQISIEAFRITTYYAYNGNGYGYRTSLPPVIYPDTTLHAAAFTCAADSAGVKSYYAAVFASLPDTIRAAFRESIKDAPLSLEAEIVAGEKKYLTDFDTASGYVGVYLKSSGAWDSAIYWRAYDSKGKIILQCKQTFIPQSDSLVSGMLPLIWAAKYSLVEGSGDLGALFGFVDRRMSLLAREPDALSVSDQALYEESGVPPLKPGEILVNASDLPKTPRDDIIIEKGTSVLSPDQRAAAAFSIIVKNNRRITLKFKSPQTSPIKAVLFDVSGRVLETWSGLRLRDLEADLNLPVAAKGCLILRVFAGNQTMQKKFTVTR